jgi:anti-anti-sigma regulatory factor
MAFEVEQRRYPGSRTTVVRPVGELSAGSIRELRTAVRRAVRDDSAVIVVDLGLASMPDADLVLPIVEAARLGQAYGAEVVVATAPGALAASLARCGLVDRRRRGQPTADASLPDPARRRQIGRQWGTT